jgi:hemolysin III
MQGATATNKPLLRGVSHQVAFFVALLATSQLVAWARPGAASRSAFVFGGSMVALFGTSALYHRRNWTDAARMLMRRLDHAAIFVLIAGGYTPLFALVPNRAGSHGALAAIWLGAGLGVVKSVAWPKAPKWLTALLCVGLGWMVVGQVMDRVAVVGSLCIGFLVASGAIYSLGAVVYATKRPDPFPKVFGYHQVFHGLVIVASICLFTHAVLVLSAVRGY